MEKARRRQVPAFGEWNYCHGYDEPPAERYASEPEDCSHVRGVDWGGTTWHARALEGGGLARATSRAACASRLVRSVDEDLYQVPPPELASRQYRP